MLSHDLAEAFDAIDDFPPLAAVAGCGCGKPNGQCACAMTPDLMPPGKGAVPMIGPEIGTHYGAKVMPANADGTDYTPPCAPYADPAMDARNMTTVVGEATIAAGATVEIPVQPTQGRFSGFYVDIVAVDAANPQVRQRARVGRFSVGDCPGDCRTITVFSDVYEANDACCAGKPLRTNFGRVNAGEELRVDINNPNAAGSMLVQVIVRGYCHRGTCAC